VDQALSRAGRAEPNCPPGIWHGGCFKPIARRNIQPATHTKSETTMRNFFFTITLGLCGLLPYAVIAAAF
jgi:hypothetical protein